MAPIYIPVSPSILCHINYYSRVGSVNTGSCGLQILDIYTGWLGSVHDARVLAHSNFYKKVNASQLLSHIYN